jgi:Peptidase family S41
MFSIKKFPVIVFLILENLCIAQVPNTIFSKISGPASRKDFILMTDTLKKIHGGLYRYQSRSELDRIFDSCRNSIKDSMTLGNFYELTRFVVSAIRDGHSNCRLPEAAMKNYIDSVKVFPAMVFFIHYKPYILCCKQNDELSQSELLTIDGHTMDSVMPRLFTYIPSDGKIDSRKNWELPEQFQLLYGSLYGLHDHFNVRFKNRNGNIQNAVLSAEPVKNIICAQPFTRPTQYLQLSYPANGIALLSIKTFLDDFLKSTGENFAGFLDSAFQALREKGIQKLIIDIRSNQGGNDENGILLYSYLSTDPFMYYSSKQTVSEIFSPAEHPELRMQQPNKNNYANKLYILENGRSFSASAEFSSIVKTNQRGIFIGEECGGAYDGNTSGSENMVVLPNSGITIRIPLVRYTMAVKPLTPLDRGVIPEYIFYPTIHDLADHTDTQLNYAILVAEKN